MEEARKKAGDHANTICDACSRSGDEKAETQYPPDYGQRTAGMRPGTYVVFCDWCMGDGNFRICNLPFEKCIKCAGTGVLTVNGDRHGDSEKRYKGRDYVPSWKEVMWIAVIFAVSVLGGCLVILWRAGAFR